jgi:hypothetical protein
MYEFVFREFTQTGLKRYTDTFPRDYATRLKRFHNYSRQSDCFKGS